MVGSLKLAIAASVAVAVEVPINAAPECRYNCGGVVDFRRAPGRVNSRKMDYNRLIDQVREPNNAYNIKAAGLVNNAIDAAVECCSSVRADEAGWHNYFVMRNFIGLPYDTEPNSAAFETACFETKDNDNIDEINDMRLLQNSSSIAVGYYNDGNCSSQASGSGGSSDNTLMVVFEPLREANPRSAREIMYSCNDIDLKGTTTTSFIKSSIWRNDTVWTEKFIDSDSYAETSDGRDACVQGNWTPSAFVREPTILQMPDFPNPGYLEATAVGRVADAAARCCLPTQLNGATFAIRGEPFFGYNEPIPLGWHESFCYPKDIEMDLYRVGNRLSNPITSADGLSAGVFVTYASPSSNFRFDREGRSIYTYYNCSDIEFRAEYPNATVPDRMYFISNGPIYVAGSAVRVAVAVTVALVALVI